MSKEKPRVIIEANKLDINGTQLTRKEMLDELLGPDHFYKIGDKTYLIMGVGGLKKLTETDCCVVGSLCDGWGDGEVDKFPGIYVAIPRVNHQHHEAHLTYVDIDPQPYVTIVSNMLSNQYTLANLTL